jgi:hypothetical protein
VKRQSQLNKSVDHDKMSLRLIMIGPNVRPMSDAFDGITAFFPDSPGRCSRATRLTSSGSLSPLRHPPADLFRPINHSRFAADFCFDTGHLITANSSFDSQLLIAASSLFSSDRRSPDAMGRSQHRHVCLLIGATPCRTTRQLYYCLS